MSYANRKLKRAERRVWAKKFLGGVCKNCGTYKNLDFDHIDRNNKLFDISQNLEAALPRLIAELEKCQLLCKKCHAHKTRLENGGQYIAQHGTRSKYINQRCRCPACTAANTAYYTNKTVAL